MKIQLSLFFILFALSSCASIATEPKTNFQKELIAHPDNINKKIELFWSKPKGSNKWPLILFINGHQYPTRSGERDFATWGVLEKWNKRGYVAAAISQPGYGNSHGPSDFCGPYTQNATLEALKYLKSKTFVNNDKVALVGISRGAIVSSMVATKDPTIRGLVLIGGSYNLEATFNSLPDDDGLKRNIRRETGATTEAFKARSAIFHSGLIQSSTLFIHGRYDDKSPVIQAKNLNQALINAGLESEIVLFETGHRVPVKDRNKHIDPFIQKVLKDTPLKFERAEHDLTKYDEEIEKMRQDFSKVPSDIENKDWVKSKLSHMVKMDQYMRNYLNIPYNNGYSEEEQKYFQNRFMHRFTLLDKENTSELKKLLKKYEWFNISDFDEQADKDAWLLVQHADLDLAFQKEVLLILTKLYPQNETNKSNYAYLYDRVKAIGEKKPQRYGTQGMCVGPGKWEPHTIEDASNVDKRRKEMGLVSMQKYKSWFKDICKSKDN